MCGKKLICATDAWTAIVDESDGNLRLRGGQAFDGQSHGNKTGIEAEFEIVLRVPDPEKAWRVLALRDQFVTVAGGDLRLCFC